MQQRVASIVQSMASRKSSSKMRGGGGDQPKKELHPVLAEAKQIQELALTSIKTDPLTEYEVAIHSENYAFSEPLPGYATSFSEVNTSVGYSPQIETPLTRLGDVRGSPQLKPVGAKCDKISISHLAAFLSAVRCPSNDCVNANDHAIRLAEILRLQFDLDAEMTTRKVTVVGRGQPPLSTSATRKLRDADKSTREADLEDAESKITRLKNEISSLKLTLEKSKERWSAAEPLTKRVKEFKESCKQLKLGFQYTMLDMFDLLQNQTKSFFELGAVKDLGGSMQKIPSGVSITKQREVEARAAALREQHPFADPTVALRAACALALGDVQQSLSSPDLAGAIAVVQQSNESVRPRSTTWEQLAASKCVDHSIVIALSTMVDALRDLASRSSFTEAQVEELKRDNSNLESEVSRVRDVLSALQHSAMTASVRSGSVAGSPAAAAGSATTEAAAMSTSPQKGKGAKGGAAAPSGKRPAASTKKGQEKKRGKSPAPESTTVEAVDRREASSQTPPPAPLAIPLPLLDTSSDGQQVQQPSSSSEQPLDVGSTSAGRDDDKAPRRGSALSDSLQPQQQKSPRTSIAAAPEQLQNSRRRSSISVAHCGTQMDKAEVITTAAQTPAVETVPRKSQTDVDVDRERMVVELNDLLDRSALAQKVMEKHISDLSEQQRKRRGSLIEAQIEVSSARAMLTNALDALLQGKEPQQIILSSSPSTAAAPSTTTPNTKKPSSSLHSRRQSSGGGESASHTPPPNDSLVQADSSLPPVAAAGGRRRISVQPLEKEQQQQQQLLRRASTMASTSSTVGGRRASRSSVVSAAEQQPTEAEAPTKIPSNDEAPPLLQQQQQYGELGGEEQEEEPLILEAAASEGPSEEEQQQQQRPQRVDSTVDQRRPSLHSTTQPIANDDDASADERTTPPRGTATADDDDVAVTATASTAPRPGREPLTQQQPQHASTPPPVVAAVEPPSPSFQPYADLLAIRRAQAELLRRSAERPISRSRSETVDPNDRQRLSELRCALVDPLQGPLRRARGRQGRGIISMLDEERAEMAKLQEGKLDVRDAQFSLPAGVNINDKIMFAPECRMPPAPRSGEKGLLRLV